MLFLLLVRFLNADIVAEELDLDETGKAAGDLFGVKLFQQSTICDIGGDDGGQLCAQPVVQQAVQIGEKEAGIELRAKIIEDQQVGIDAVWNSASSSPFGSEPKCSASSLPKKSGQET